MNNGIGSNKSKARIILALLIVGIFVASGGLFGITSYYTSISGTHNELHPFTVVSNSNYSNSTLLDGLVTPTVFSSLNYFSPVEEYYIVSLLYQPFATFLYPPGNSLEGILGQTWTHNANFTIWNLTLRSNLKWDNGSPLNSTDLWFSLMVYKQLGFFADYSIKDIKIVNSTTVQVSSYLPQPNFVVVWATDTGSIIVPYQSFYKYDTNLSSTNVSKLSTFNNFDNIVADGPFVIGNYTPGENPILFKANPYFYRGKPEMGYLSIRLFSSESSYSAAMRSGEIDEMWDIGPYNTVISPIFTGIPDSTIYQSVPAAYESAEFNLNLWPYNTTQFRMAIAYLTCRSSVNSIVNEANNSSLVDYALLPTSLASSIGLKSSSIDNYVYNTSKAIKLLSDIGIIKDTTTGSSNYGLFIFNNPSLPDYGKPVTINIVTTPAGDGDVSTATELSNQWTKAGFDVSISTLASDPFYSLIKSKSGWDVAVQLLDTIAPTATATISSAEISCYSNATNNHDFKNSFGVQNFNFSILVNLSKKAFEYPFGSSNSNYYTSEIGEYLDEIVPTIPLWSTSNWVVVSNEFYWGNETSHTGLFSTQTLSMQPLWSGTLWVVHPLVSTKTTTSSSDLYLYVIAGVVAAVVVIGGVAGVMTSKKHKKAREGEEREDDDK